MTITVRMGFVLVWSEDLSGWFVLLDNKACRFVEGAVAEAMNAGLEMTGAAEADVDCVVDEGDFYRFRPTAEEF